MLKLTKMARTYVRAIWQYLSMNGINIDSTTYREYFFLFLLRLFCT